MDISAATAAAGATGGGSAGTGANSGTGTSALSSDFATFLRMLTAQLQNQDPLNPIESTDFAVQLATFSQVEQQVRTNDLLDSLGTQMAVLGLSQLAGWVGLEARVAAPVAGGEATPLALALAPRTGADAAELVVSNARGEVVQRLPVDPQATEGRWDGSGLASGLYTLTLTSYRGGQELGQDPVEHYATVREARNAGGSVTLQLASGAQVPAAEVQAIRAPQGRS